MWRRTDVVIVNNDRIFKEEKYEYLLIYIQRKLEENKH